MTAVLEPEPEAQTSGWWRPQDRLPLGELAFWLLGLFAAAYLLRLGSRTTFFFDEWSWIQERRGWAPGNFLNNHNGHFSIVPVFVYHLLFATAGLRAYLPYRLVLMVVHLLTAYTLYRYSARRIGPLMGLIPAGVILLLGAAWQDLFWPFQIGFLGAIAFGMAALLLLDGPADRRRDIAACLCLLGAIGCSSTGLPLLFAAALRSALKREWRRWPVFAVPVVVYLVWFARYGLRHSKRASLGDMLTYVGDSIRAGLSAATGVDGSRWHSVAALLGLLLLAGIILRVVQSLRSGRLPADLIAVVAATLVLWGLTAITRASYHDAEASRYLYVDVFLLLAVAVEVLRGISFAVDTPRRVVAGVLAVAAVLSTWSGLAELHRGARSLTSTSTYVRAELAALEHARPAAKYRPDKQRMPMVTAGRYLSARHALGSPAMPWSEIPAQNELVREAVDRVLLQAGGNLNYAPTSTSDSAGDGPAPGLDSITGGSSRVAGPCIIATPNSGPMRITFALRRRLTVNSAGLAYLYARRFGGHLYGFRNQDGHRTAELSQTADGSTVPWTLQIASATALTLCS